MQVSFKVDQIAALKLGVDTTGSTARADVTPSTMLQADRDLLAKYLAADGSVRWDVAKVETTVVVAGQTLEALLAKLRTGKP